jgi:Pentapeptide repeats (8 copies)
MANPEHVEVVKQGAEAIRKWREENPNVRLDLRGASLEGTDLRGADLSEADLSEANLAEADLRGAWLYFTDLHGAELYRANLRGAELIGVHGAERADGLETVRLVPAEDGLGSDAGNDATYFETCHRSWPERFVDWERLRGVGRLPLFGISYTALILIPIAFYGLALYNDKVELARAWAEPVIALPDHPWHRLALLIRDRLHPRPLPSQSLLLLISTVLLAAGSTLYTFFSPSRIKEFSRDQWCDQLGRSLLHYWPLAWKHRYIRLICASCYALGGAGALWMIGTKVWHTALFIWKHSTWSWPWW